MFLFLVDNNFTDGGGSCNECSRFAFVVLVYFLDVNWCHPPLEHHSLWGPGGKEEGGKGSSILLLEGLVQVFELPTK